MTNSLLTEKNFAKATAVGAFLLPIIYFVKQPNILSELSSFDGWFLIATNLAIFWAAFVAASIWHLRTRFAAMAGSILTSCAVFVLLACQIDKSGDPKAGALWIAFIACSAVSFLLATLVVNCKFSIFEKTAVGAFIAGALLNLAGVALLAWAFV